MGGKETSLTYFRSGGLTPQTPPPFTDLEAFEMLKKHPGKVNTHIDEAAIRLDVCRSSKVACLPNISDCKYEVPQLFNARNGIKKISGMASVYRSTDYSMPWPRPTWFLTPCLASIS